MSVQFADLVRFSAEQPHVWERVVMPLGYVGPALRELFFIRNSQFCGTQTHKCGLRFEGSARDTLTTIIKFKKEIVVNFVEFAVNDFKN
jgi:hypothetical protein